MLELIDSEETAITKPIDQKIKREPKQKFHSYEDAFKKSLEYFDGDDLAAKVFLDKYALKDHDNNLLEETPTDMHWRIAKEFARIEKNKFKKPLSEKEIFDLLDKFKRITVQGSPMYAIGNKYQYVSAGNCFVIPSPLDSLLSILYTDSQIAQITCRRGGVGWSISNLRPKGLPVQNAAKTTSGAIEFMKRFSNTIREIGQFGRRGASLQSISCYHPDISEFIKIKQDLTQVTGSNISIEFTDEFMEAVVDDKEIELKFPVNSNNPQIRKKIKAKEIWNEFVHSAWKTAEPGCMFISKVHKESPGVPYGHVETSSNPCGEQYLPPYASCRLLLINLYSYVKNPFTKNAVFDFDLFSKDVKLMQRLGDDLVDIEIECVDRIINKINSDPEPLEIKQIGIDLWQNIKRVAIEDRRTGCGLTGLGDTIAALGIIYGSEESIKFAGDMQKKFALSAYESSIDMAEEIGAFPLFDAKKDSQSLFIQKIAKASPEIFNKMQKFGRRNMVLLTIAPAGSVSCLTQTTSGLEPVFQLNYMRRKKGNPGDSQFRSDFVDQSGDHWMHFNVHHHGFRKWSEITKETNVQKSPYYKSTANEIDWKGRVKMQSALQLWTDNSISTTINIAEDTSEDVVSQIYLESWKLGCKGMTIYRNNCRSGVLVDVQKPPQNQQSNNLTKTKSPKRPESLSAEIHHFTLNKQRYYVVVGLWEDGSPYEIFTGINHNDDGEIIIPKSVKNGNIIKHERGKYSFICGESQWHLTNGHNDDTADSLTRLISCALRHGASIEFVCSQLEKTKGLMFSFSKALYRALKKYIKDGSSKPGETCPQCKTESLIYSSGCTTCSNCGFSKC